MKDQLLVQKEAEQIYLEWDKQLSQGDLTALMALYAPEATLESPIVLDLMKGETGICHNKEEIRQFLERSIQRMPTIRKFYKKNIMTDGKTVICEYSRVTPEGEQIDILMVTEVKDGLIACQRVYWGWKGFKVLQADAFRR